MDVRRYFSRDCNVDIFYPFEVAENTNGRSQTALLFLHHEENALC